MWYISYNYLAQIITILHKKITKTRFEALNNK